MANNALGQTLVTDSPDLVCYSKDERTKIAQGIVSLRKCEIDLAAKEDLIKKNMLTFDGVNPGPSWWQEPTFVWGGMVVSFAAGGIVTYLIMRDK